jgi:ankyrin repeat protein
MDQPPVVASLRPTSRPIALWVVVAVLLLVVGFLYLRIESLTQELRSPSSHSRPVVTSVGGRSVRSPEAARDAIAAGDVGALKRELEGGVDPGAAVQIEGGSRRQMPILVFAAMQGNPDMVAALIEKGAKIETASADGWTPLMMGAARGDAATFQAILRARPALDARNKWGQTALMIGARAGEEEKVRALIAAGADAKAADEEGNTALALAAGAEGPAGVLKALLDAGADADAADREKVTPLMRAADRGDVDKCVLLLNGGARADLKDSDGRTALEWAKQRSDAAGERCVEVLSRVGH